MKLSSYSLLTVSKVTFIVAQAKGWWFIAVPATFASCCLSRKETTPTSLAWWQLFLGMIAVVATSSVSAIHVFVMWNAHAAFAAEFGVAASYVALLSHLYHPTQTTNNMYAWALAVNTVPTVSMEGRVALAAAIAAIYDLASHSVVAVARYGTPLLFTFRNDDARWTSIGVGDVVIPALLTRSVKGSTAGAVVGFACGLCAAHALAVENESFPTLVLLVPCCLLGKRLSAARCYY